MGGRAKSLKGSGRYRLLVTVGVSHEHERYNVGNGVNHTVIVLYGDRWDLCLW